MNIVIICTLYPPYTNGGAEISTQLLAEDLAKQGNKVSVITTSSINEHEIKNGIKIFRIKNRNIYWKYPQRDKFLFLKFIWHIIDISNYFYWYSVNKLLKEIKPDVVHTNNLCGLSSIVWKISKKLKIPIVHTLRDYYLICPQQAMIKKGIACPKQCSTCYLFSIVKKMNSKCVNAVVGISDFILQKHLSLDYFQNAKYSYTIPNAIGGNTIEKQQSIKRNSIIGYLGRISPEKGIEYLADSFLQSNIIGKQLWIAGNGNKKYVDGVKKHYSKFKQIHFLGYKDSFDFLSEIDLLVVPSLWDEPFGRVVIEAFSMNVPVFASMNGGLPEIIDDKIGRLFNTKDQKSLINLFNDYFSNQIIFDNNDFEDICSKYDSKHIALSYLNLFTQIKKDNENSLSS